jgi:hypothetical protein
MRFSGENVPRMTGTTDRYPRRERDAAESVSDAQYATTADTASPQVS